METTLNSMLADFAERELPALTPRELHLAEVPGSASVVVGMRRTGKTWYLYQAIRALEAEGVGRERVLYLNFEDERLLPMGPADLHLIPEVFFRHHPESHGKRCVFFFDEIQRIPGWELFVRRLLEGANHRIVLTGSSSRLLSKEIATELRGRSMASELFPFSFSESLRHSGLTVPSRPPGAGRRARLESEFSAYLRRGGFPAVQALDSELRVRVLQGYVDAVLLRDVVERYSIGNVTPLRHMIRHLVKNPAGRFTVNRFHNDLSSLGVRTAKDSLYDYFDHLCEAFLFFPVYLHSRSERARMVNPRKVYPVDTGLALAFALPPAAITGQILETAVFLHLRRQAFDIEYYQTRSGREVDFLITRADSTRFLVQSCLNLCDPATLKREVAGLSEAMKELGLRTATIVTLHENRTIEVPCGRMDVRPAWWWTLSPTRPAAEQGPAG